MGRYLFVKNPKLPEREGRKRLEIGLTKNLTILAAIDRNVPYIQLPGRVPEMMLTFYTIGVEDTLSRQRSW